MANDQDIDFYEVLNIPRTATEAEIKKAYRTQALKWHPDKNLDNKEQAEMMFKRIAEAYEVLSDSKKRDIYDRYGLQGLMGGNGNTSSSRFQHTYSPFFHFRDPMDLFSEFFGGNDPFRDSFGIFGFGPMSRVHSFNSPFGAFGGFGGFGLQQGFDDMFSGGGGTNSFHYSTSFGGPSANICSSSTSTTYINGKRVTTKKVVQNGQETVTTEENGVVTSMKVNGKEQLGRLEYQTAGGSSSSSNRGTYQEIQPSLLTVRKNSPRDQHKTKTDSRPGRESPNPKSPDLPGNKKSYKKRKSPYDDGR